MNTIKSKTLKPTGRGGNPTQSLHSIAKQFTLMKVTLSLLNTSLIPNHKKKKNLEAFHLTYP